MCHHLCMDFPLRVPSGLRQVAKRVASVCLGLALIAVPASVASEDVAAPVPGTLSLSARYSSRVLIFPVGDITFEARLEDRTYSASTRIEAAGLAALFTDFDINAEVLGYFQGADASPSRYAHVERTGRKVRSVEVSFPQGVASSAVEPPFGSWGVPPASEHDRTGAIDPMSAFVALSEQLSRGGGQGCEGVLPVFDGKSRYNLRLENRGQDRIRTRGWRGNALMCDIWYEPVSGYDPEDLPSERELSQPLRVWLAPIEGGRYYLPVRLYTRAGLGGVTIELTQVSAA